jgi:hypothetical protein
MPGGKIKLEENGTIEMGISNSVPETPDQYYVTIFAQNNAIKYINQNNNVYELGIAGRVPSDTTANILAIVDATAGMIRYSTDDQVMAFYNGSAWIRLQNNGNL